MDAGTCETNKHFETIKKLALNKPETEHQQLSEG
jgi:hypothetical protein